MKRAIITGANGFLGSALVQSLLKQGTEVWAVVRPGTKRIERLEGAYIVECDLTEMASLDGKLPPGDYCALYHFAWAGTSGKERADYPLQLANVRHSCDALATAKRIGCHKFVFAGSIMAHECVKQIPIDGLKPKASQIYGTAKLCAQFMLKTLAVQIGMEFVEAIISNVYGAGEYSERFVISALKKLLKGERVPFSSGEQMYDFLYITDAIDALILLGEKGEDGHSYYVGHEKPRPLKEFLREMADCASPKMPLALGELEIGQAPQLTYREFDTGKMKREFGFEPKVSFEEGIQLLISWLRQIQAEEK